MTVLRRIALVGLPGSGKSTISPLVAAQLGWTSIDLDLEIERSSGRTPAAIIATDGEAQFRDLELTALEHALRDPGPLVIACGGGVITQPAARRLLMELCTVVWLDASDDILIQRLGDGRDRPCSAAPPNPGSRACAAAGRARSRRRTSTSPPVTGRVRRRSRDSGARKRGARQSRGTRVPRRGPGGSHR